MKKSISFLMSLCTIAIIGCQQEAQSNAQFNSETLHTIESQKHDFEVVSLVSGLEHPWGMVFIDANQVLLTERSGGLKYVNINEKKVIPVEGAPKVFAQGQGGMLDIQLHPEFEKNNLLYISYAGRDKVRKKASGTELLQAKFVLDKNITNPRITEQKVIFKAEKKGSGSQHYGGRIVLDKDYVYLSLGERGQKDWAQNRENHWGSMIRLHHDGRVPKDNPFVDQENSQDAIYSYGHRNPQGLAWNPETGELWQHEHGPQGGDEINIIEKGKNYGWPVVTHGKQYVTGFDIGEGVSKPGMQDPVYQWTPSIAPSGMAFYTGDQFENWRHNLFVGALKFKKLVRLELDGSKITASEDLLEDMIGRIRDVEVSPDGLVYLLTDDSNGQLIQLKPE